METLASAIRKKKDVKGIQIMKEEIKLVMQKTQESTKIFLILKSYDTNTVKCKARYKGRCHHIQ